jgi:tetratricopeptide (TPR) repeat protein
MLADVLEREGKLEEAEDRAREAFTLSQKLRSAGACPLEATIDPVDALVSILLARNKGGEAEQLLRNLVNATPEGQQERFYFLRVRSSFFARSRRWKEAAAELSKVVELDASDEGTAIALAVLLLEIGDRENYRVQCQKMMTSFRAANAPGPLGKTAEACLLVPTDSGDPEARQLAEQAFKLGQSSYGRYDLQFIKGLAEYRAGNFAGAIDWVGKSIGQPTMVSGPRPDPAAFSVLAMAQHQLKRPQEARAALAKGADIVNTKLLNLENAPLDENWVDWLIAHILLREAQALIER